MLTFHLKKIWFEKIKSGEKTHEYREVNQYWHKRIFQAAVQHYFSKNSDDSNWTTYSKELIGAKIVFKLGYPKNTEKEKFLYAVIVDFKQLDTGIATDLKINKPVYDIEFKLIKDVNNDRINI